MDLRYPVNLARNLAKEAVSSTWELLADFELVPSAGFAVALRPLLSSREPSIPISISPIQEGTRRGAGDPSVFVVPVFEAAEGAGVPGTMGHLRALLAAKSAIPFHVKRSAECHRIPGLQGWLNHSGATA